MRQNTLTMNTTISRAHLNSGYASVRTAEWHALSCTHPSTAIASYRKPKQPLSLAAAAHLV
jgi:hypothetical protein